MNFWERITGSDLTRDWAALDARAAELPDDYRRAWDQIRGHLMQHGDFSARNLTPIMDGVLGLLETSVADGQSAEDALGVDLEGFSAALVGADSAAKDYRQRWREQLNANVARKLSKLGD